MGPLRKGPNDPPGEGHLPLAFFVVARQECDK